MKLNITTQIEENYGAHDWDGVGECPQYWKFKGGNDYMVKGINTDEQATQVVMALRGQMECDNPGFREYIVGWRLVSNDFLTEFEQSQLAYEGEIRHPARELAW